MDPMSQGSSPAERSPGLRLAVVIPAYNRRELLIETLLSVQKQTILPWRLVIVDDGSSDGTAEIAEEWLSIHLPDRDVKVIRQPNAGVSTARNRGARECENADLLAFLDSDDLWPTDFIDQALQVFSRNPEVVAATNDRLDVEHGPTGQQEKLSIWPISNELATRAMNQKILAYPSCTVYRASAFHGAGGFASGLNYGEDYILSLIVSSFGPWGRIEGPPTQRRKFSTTEHLSTVPGADTMRKFASILETEARKHGCVGPLKQAITHRWRRAGKAMAAEGKLREARDCYARALGCDVWDMKARLRKWMLTFAR